MSGETGPARFRSLDATSVIDTIGRLHSRIIERFPEAELANVCAELRVIANENSDRARRIAARNVPLRLAIFVVLTAGAAVLGWIGLLFLTFPAATDNIFSVLQGVEAAVNMVVLIGAAAFFLTRIEDRLKRRSALAALHELRSIIHVIDMHQLTKDPGAMVIIGDTTQSSPPRPLSRFEVARYLDYCSEMLSLSAKVAVLFAQVFPDDAVIEMVSDIEHTAAGLSQKIWQKIMILQALVPAPGWNAPPAAAISPGLP